MNKHEFIIEAEGTIPDTDQQFTFVLTQRGWGSNRQDITGLRVDRGVVK